MNYAECRFRDPLLLQHGFYKNIPDENEQLKSDNECYVKRYSELFEDYIACKKENEQLKKTNQELNDELQETIGYLSLKSGVEKENEQLKQQHRQLQIEFNDACGIVHDLRESKLDLEDENEQLKQQIGNLEHTRDFCAECCERLEKENEELKFEIRKVQRAYEQLWEHTYK